MRRKQPRRIASPATPWLAFLHSDDLYREDFLAEMLGAASRAPIPSRTIVYSECQHRAADGRLGRVERPPRDDHQHYLCTACIFYTCSVIVARAIFVEIGGYDETLRTAEDWDLYVRLFAAGAQPIGVRTAPVDLSTAAGLAGQDLRSDVP